MDPFTLLLLTLIVLGGGTGGAIAVSYQSYRRAQLGKLLREPVAHLDGQLSIFDVFWDLGVSDFALTLMAYDELLLHEAGDFERAHSRLDDHIRACGGYQGYLTTSLESIEEFYREHRRAGNRRRPAMLKGEGRKLLALPSSSTSAARTARSDALVPLTGHSPAMVRPPARDTALQTMTFQTDLDTPYTPAGQVHIDIDELTRFKPGQMLSNIFNGFWRHELKKWWQFRELRAAKQSLDEALLSLYNLYAEVVSRQPGYFDTLYDIPRRWHQEMQRIQAMKRKESWRGEPWALTARVLVEEAEALTRDLVTRTELNVRQTVERIHSAARANDLPTAGYILYMNQHAFFAGRAPDYGVYIQRIDRQVHRVQRELQKLSRSGSL